MVFRLLWISHAITGAEIEALLMIEEWWVCTLYMYMLDRIYTSYDT